MSVAIELELMTAPEVAKLLRVNQVKVNQWIRSGELLATNISQGEKLPRYRVSRADLEAFLAARSTRPSKQKPRRR